MPVVTEVEISVRQKKMMWARAEEELAYQNTEEELELWKKGFELELEIITEKQTDENWNQVINEAINTQQQLIKLKQELNICQ